MLRVRIWLRHVAIAALACGIGGCSSDPGTSNVLPAPDAILKRPDWTSFSGAKNEFALRPVSAEDLVNAEGACVLAGAGQAASFAEPTTGNPHSAAVALQMTECDVVRRAGAPEKIELGTDERGDRAVVLTYIRGPLPGVYRFAGGRLAAIERAPGSPSAVGKPQKPARTAKKPAS